MRWLTQMSVPTMARALDQQVFCYFGLPEQYTLIKAAVLVATYERSL